MKTHIIVVRVAHPQSASTPLVDGIAGFITPRPQSVAASPLALVSSCVTLHVVVL